MSEQSERIDQNRPLVISSSDDAPVRYTGNRRAASVAASRPQTHQVANGDSLYSIAFQHDLDYRDLARANNLAAPYRITVGQQLSLNVDQPVLIAQNGGESATGTINRVVPNSGVARAQPASATTAAVTRQPISRTAIVSEPVNSTPPEAAPASPPETMPAPSPEALPATPSATPSPLPELNREPNWQWPLRGEVLTSFQADTSATKGIDIDGREGQPVLAAAAGEVVYAGNGIQGSGNLIIIRHNDQYLSAYAHNRQMLVVEGQRVESGEPIGEVGTNLLGRPLLHFEIRHEGKPVDPLGFLPAR